MSFFADESDRLSKEIDYAAQRFKYNSPERKAATAAWRNHMATGPLAAVSVELPRETIEHKTRKSYAPPQPKAKPIRPLDPLSDFLPARTAGRPLAPAYHAKDGEKRCKKCEAVKPVGEFQKCTRNHDGLRATCKICKNAQQREYTRSARQAASA